MALPFGSIVAFEFDPSLEDWISYSERVDHYLEANEVSPDSKKLSVLLSTCGKATYTLILNLMSPVSPSSKTYKEIIAIVTELHQLWLRDLSLIDGFVIVENLCLCLFLNFANCHDTVILETD